MKKWKLGTLCGAILFGAMSFAPSTFASSLPDGTCNSGTGSTVTCVTREDRPGNTNWVVETTTTYSWTFNTSTGTFGWSVISVSVRTVPGDRRQEQ